MKERGILMSAAMVRALLAGTKTQTRRIVTPQPVCQSHMNDSWHWEGGRALRRVGYGETYVHTNLSHVRRAMLAICPYGQPGDRLYVKETHAPQADCWGAWGAWMDGDRCRPRPIIHYRASFEPFQDGQGFMIRKPFIERWRPALHMPRWASRITLELTDVRVERLQDISTADCWAEGIHASPDVDPVHEYLDLWESINGAGSWEQNPFVWVIRFRRVG